VLMRIIVFLFGPQRLRERAGYGAARVTS